MTTEHDTDPSEPAGAGATQFEERLKGLYDPHGIYSSDDIAQEVGRVGEMLRPEGEGS